jgi:hypothetical protein
LAQRLGSASVLSNQALFILQQFADSGASWFVHLQIGTHALLGMSDGKNIEIQEARFLDDDIQMLVTLGFITLTRYNSSGRPIYSLTRPGLSYAEMTKESQPKS